MYVAIDPGKDTGWAIWASDGQLVACGLGDPRSHERHVAAEIDDVWIELPFVYPRSKTPPNDLITLGINAGEWGGQYKTLVVDVHYVWPFQWKGQLPKDICHARSWSHLSEREQSIVSLAGRGVAKSNLHNMLDAVAFGLWVAKRAFR